MEQIIKPKLVFFQWEHEEIPKFLRLHLQQHVRCLSEFFEVIVINQACDYKQICDKYHPDLVLFESGVYGGKREIKNTRAYPEIPKLGFLHADAYCMSREACLSDMEHWGIDTFFSLCVSMGEYIPEIADNLFIWPNFIDGSLYRDYGESKMIPVLFTGSQATHYPWRNRISKIVSQNYPSLMCPHFGWSGKGIATRMIYGEQYARMLNASWVVPTCGTIAKEVVRKHFEIPASKSCLITEKTPALEAAGFIDMLNCVLADEHDVLDKLDYLFQHPDELERITNAGYELVHSRHTSKQRDEIFQWFNLFKNLKAEQKIVQTSPFEPLAIVDKYSGIKNSQIIGHGLDRVLLRQGDEKLWAGQYDEAEALYLRCLNYHAYVPEPKLRLALCNLYKGKPELAISWILQPIQATLEVYKALDPDPVEWAYLVIALLCQGKLDDAVENANQFPSLCHSELTRTRWAIDILINKGNKATIPPNEQQSKSRYSLHQLPNLSINEWVENLCVMLRACQQFHLAERLIASVSIEKQSLKGKPINSGSSINSQKLVDKNQLKFLHKLFLKSATDSKVDLRPISEPNSIKLKKWLKPKFKKFVLQPINHLENRFGYFLPYRFSEAKNDEFFGAMQKLIREEEIETALVIGAVVGARSTEAFLTGIRENKNKPTVFCINLSTPRFVELQKRYANNSIVKCASVSSSSLGKFDNLVENSIKQIKQENNITKFDVVLIDKSEINISAEVTEELHGTRFIFLDDINTFDNYSNHRKLLADDNYILDSQNPCLRNGYAIFKKLNPNRSYIAGSGRF